MAGTLGNCAKCEQPIYGRALTHRDLNFHPPCLACAECQTTLDGIKFYMIDEERYCPGCYTTLFAKTCASCGEKIVGVRAMEHRGNSYHYDCFLCLDCKAPIGKKEFIIKEGEFICIDCYYDHHAKTCNKCNEVIQMEGVTYRGDAYHKECFVCNDCNQPLASQKFYVLDDRYICCNCHLDNYAKTCAVCNDKITDKILTFNDCHYHQGCLVCSQCENSLAGKSFYQRGENMYVCVDCGSSS